MPAISGSTALAAACHDWRFRMMIRKLFALGLLATTVWAAAPALARAADYHHVHLTASNGEDAAQWYIRHMGCQALRNRKDAAQCGTVLLLFFARAPKGASEGTGVNHIGFSFRDLTTKMKELEAAGVKVATPLRDAPGLFKLAFVEDPWGTRIEVVEDLEYLGFHHIHLRSPDPDATSKWYQNVFGGQPAKLKGRLDGLLYGTTWLLVGRQTEGQLAPTEGRAVDHLGFSFPNLDAAAAEFKKKGVTFQAEPRDVQSTVASRIAFVIGPDDVRIEVVQPPK
jgi:catechol 2,3-dioxygenase-like lactoylglutathione lyase family enzyme